MIDPIEAFVQFCLDDAGIVAAVEGRVVGSPPGLSALAGTVFAPNGVPYASLVVSQGAGIMRDHIPVMEPTLYVRAYGQDGYETQQIMLALQNALYATSGNLAGTLKQNVMIADRWFMYYARMGSLPTLTLEPISTWPVAYAIVQTKFDSLRGA